MILRLQTEEELQLLQSRIKSRSKGVIAHVNELRTNTGTAAARRDNKARVDWTIPTDHTGTDPEKGDHAALQSGLYEIAGVASVKNTPRKPHKGRAATFEHQLLGRQLTQAGIAFREEFRFEPKRRWRFDFLVDNYGIEIDGGLWIRGRHSRGAGQLGDMEKQNHAALLGFHILRFSPDQVKSGEAIGFIERVLASLRGA